MSHEDLMGEPLTVSGWGLINSESAMLPEYLMHVSVTKLDNNICNSIFRNNLLENQLCLGDPTGKVYILYYS